MGEEFGSLNGTPRRRGGPDAEEDASFYRPRSVRIGPVQRGARRVPIALGRQLFEDPTHNYAAPGVGLPPFVHLEGDARLGAHGRELLTRHRVPVDKPILVGI